MREKRRGDVDAPAFGLYFDYTADDQIADLGYVACAEWEDREEFVGFLEGACYGCVDCGGLGGGVGSVASERRRGG